jgi:hypothetical protein
MLVVTSCLVDTDVIPHKDTGGHAALATFE